MIIVVCGPTAVGKTKLSETLAKRYNGIIVNADSMQVYKSLNIGTAKVTPSEMEDVPHYLFDIVEPNINYTAFDYQKDARDVISKNKDKTIVMVGGTGLYIKAALYNYEFKERDTYKTFDEYTNKELYDMLTKMNLNDKVHINNRRRMISMLNSGGNTNKKDELLYDSIFIGLTTNRDELYRRIDDRVDDMMNDGLLDEVKKVYSKYGKSKPLMTGIGYKEIIDYLDGNISLDEAANLIKKNSRHYAKRQYTWFNNQMDVNWFNTDYDNFDNTIKDVEDYIDRI